jgi:signal transduction protein with GAF and PtsI domain
MTPLTPEREKEIRDSAEKCGCQFCAIKLELLAELDRVRENQELLCKEIKDQDKELETLHSQLEVAIDALDFYSFGNFAVEKSTYKVLELKRMMPGIVWACDHPTEAEMPVKAGTLAKEALTKIEGMGK